MSAGQQISFKRADGAEVPALVFGEGEFRVCGVGRVWVTWLWARWSRRRRGALRQLRTGVRREAARILTHPC